MRPRGRRRARSADATLARTHALTGARWIVVVRGAAGAAAPRHRPGRRPESERGSAPVKIPPLHALLLASDGPAAARKTVAARAWRSSSITFMTQLQFR